MSPNINDMSEFLKPTDIENGDVVTFVDAGQIVEREFAGQPKKKVFEITVEFSDGKEKTATLNKTSRDILGNFWGVQTEEWVNKRARITKAKQNVGGQMKDVMTFQPAD